MVGLSTWPFSRRLIMARSIPDRSARSEILKPCCSRSAFKAAKGLAKLPVLSHREHLGDIAALDKIFQRRFFLLEFLADRLFRRLLLGSLYSWAMDARGFLCHDKLPSFIDFVGRHGADNERKADRLLTH